MKGRQPPLERDVRRPCAADEANGARADAEAGCGRRLGRDDLGAQPHAEIIVGVHSQKAPFAFAFDEIAWTLALLWRRDSADDCFVTFRSACPSKLIKPRRERSAQFFVLH